MINGIGILWWGDAKGDVKGAIGNFSNIDNIQTLGVALPLLTSW